ncbi:hypothetical protein TWF281_005993 [Arthrobotrys megalospora]
MTPAQPSMLRFIVLVAARLATKIIATLRRYGAKKARAWRPQAEEPEQDIGLGGIGSAHNTPHVEENHPGLRP